MTEPLGTRQEAQADFQMQLKDFSYAYGLLPEFTSNLHLYTASPMTTFVLDSVRQADLYLESGLKNGGFSKDEQSQYEEFADSLYLGFSAQAVNFVTESQTFNPDVVLMTDDRDDSTNYNLNDIFPHESILRSRLNKTKEPKKTLLAYRTLTRMSMALFD